MPFELQNVGICCCITVEVVRRFSLWATGRGMLKELVCTKCGLGANGITAVPDGHTQSRSEKLAVIESDNTR